MISHPFPNGYIWLMVAVHPHAKSRALERGATESEIINVIETGEVFPAKYGRTGFRKTVIYFDIWKGNILCPTN